MIIWRWFICLILGHKTKSKAFYFGGARVCGTQCSRCKKWVDDQYRFQWFYALIYYLRQPIQCLFRHDYIHVLPKEMKHSHQQCNRCGTFKPFLIPSSIRSLNENRQILNQ